MGEVETRSGPDGTRFREIRTFDQLASTNQYVLEAAARGEASGLVVIARDQTAGRGRRGRVWDSKRGASLLFSVLFEPTEDLAPHRFGQALGLAVVDACQLYAGFGSTLKWPNDVLVGDRKLAGVLVEAVTQGEQMYVAAGCGVNVNWGDSLPVALKASAISADEPAGQSLDIAMFTDRVLRALEERLANSSWIAEAYRRHCSTIGRPVRIELADRFIEGIADDVGDDGALSVLKSDGERETITFGEVIHLRPVTDPPHAG